MTPRRWAWASLATIVLSAAIVLAVGEWLSRPARHPVGPPPAALNAQAIALSVRPGEALQGWFARGQPGAGAVLLLLLHGIRGDRTSMLARALALQRAGHAVMLIDLQAHGQSTGERITFGLREAVGVRVALAWLRTQLPGEKVGVLGVSLGAASVVLAQPQPAADVLVLESMYPTIEDAVTDRIAARLGRPLAQLLAPMLLWQLPLRLDMDPQRLRPLDRMPGLGAPVLVASGTQDQHTPWPETQRLFDAASSPKELWAVQGAGHVDLHAFNPEAYEARVLPFLARHLQAQRPP